MGDAADSYGYRGGQSTYHWSEVQQIESGLRRQIANLEEKNRQLEARVERLRAVLQSLRAVINESHGVAGYHLNGDIATWDEFDYPEEIDAALADTQEGVSRE